MKRRGASSHFTGRLLATTAMALVAIMGVFGCSGSESEDSARFRIVHASPSTPPISVTVDGNRDFEQLTYGESSEYRSIAADRHRIRINAEGIVASIYDQDRSFAVDDDYTLFVYGDIGEIRAAFIKDDNEGPQRDEFRIRVAHFAEGSGTVDVYITNPDDDLSGQVPVVSSLSFASLSRYLDIQGGEYRIRVTPHDSSTVLLDSGAVELRSGSVYTIVALKDDNSSQVSGTLLEDNLQ